MSRLLQRILRASLPLAIAACSLPSARQDIAEKPDLRLGDEWGFHVTGGARGNPVDRRWRRRIVESLPGEKFAFNRSMRASMYSTHHGIPDTRNAPLS